MHTLLTKTSSLVSLFYITPPTILAPHHKLRSPSRQHPSHPNNPKTRSMSTEAASTAIPIGDTSSGTKGKAPAAPTTRFATIIKSTREKGGWKRGVALFDFLLRLFALGACLTATITMGTTNETLPFFTQFFQFRANYDDLPALTFFVIGNAIAGGYLVLSLPFSIIGIVRPLAVGPRLLLIICDIVMVALTTAAAASAAAIVYLAHNGNSKANWVAICLQFDDFCQRISGAVVASFVATVIFMLLVVMSALALRKH